MMGQVSARVNRFFRGSHKGKTGLVLSASLHALLGSVSTRWLLLPSSTKTSLFCLPTWIEDEQLSRNPPGHQHQNETVKAPSPVD